MRRPWCGRCSGPWTSGTAAADPSRPGCRFLSCCVSLDLTERLLPLTVAALAALGFTPRPSARPPPPFRWHLPADTAERAPRGLFDSADPIEIALAADFDAVAKDRGTEKHVHAGVLSYGSPAGDTVSLNRSEEHTSELQSLAYLVCRLLLEKKKKSKTILHMCLKH